MIEWLDDWMIGWLDDWMIGWLDDWMIEWLDDWMIGWLDDWMIGWLDDWMIECHFYPFLKKRWHAVLYLVVFNQWLMMRFIQIQWCVFVLCFCFLIMCFILIMRFIFLSYDVLYLYLFKALFLPPFPSFPIIFIHSFQTLKFLSHSKNFKQTLSTACL